MRWQLKIPCRQLLSLGRDHQQTRWLIFCRPHNMHRYNFIRYFLLLPILLQINTIKLICQQSNSAWIDNIFDIPFKLFVVCFTCLLDLFNVLTVKRHFKFVFIKFIRYSALFKGFCKFCVLLKVEILQCIKAWI